ncbi:hypothetical protein GV64_09775 [Endozoicomonas elysicola]|uniref:Uncharacterized protein n=1 Tax=Endozoicomonas elysicola TaxID=305900 RepID=A0A081KA18_9GAMM|nr:hypothetical protein GV64_09775 [Endozoicomonas elysicola]
MECFDQLVAEICPRGTKFSEIGVNILCGEWREKLFKVCQGLKDDQGFAKEVLKKSLMYLRSGNPEKQEKILPITIKNFLMPFLESWVARNFQNEFGAITSALSNCIFFKALNACIVYSRHPDTHQHHPALSLNLQGTGWSRPVSLTYFIENALGGHEQGFRHSMLFDLEILCFMKQWEHRHNGFHVDVRTSLNFREYSKSILEIILINNINRSRWTEPLDFSSFFQVDCNGPELCKGDLLFRLGEIHQQLAHNESGHRTGDDVTEYKSFKKLYLAEKEKQLSGNTTKFEAL